MKRFTRIEPTIVQEYGKRYKRRVVIKNFRTDGGKIHQFTTFLDEGSRAGAVIALTPDNNVVVAHQFRAGPEKWMHEIPGGGIVAGEDPKAGVMRELAEETGYTSDNVKLLGTSCRGSYFNCTWYYYLAYDCVKAEMHHMDKEESDQGMEIRLITIDELIDFAKHDGMTDPAAVLMAYDELQKIRRGM